MFSESRLLHEKSPTQQYKPSKTATLDDVVVKGLHYGQRKLLLSEIEALTYWRREDTPGKPVLVVYAGAAPGVHTPFLFSLFPELKFILIDPANFDPQLIEASEAENSPVLELINDICTDELCIRLSRSYGPDYFMFFISDIRTGNPSRMKTNLEHTELIVLDNNLQKSWCYSLKADAALLKFHPPYPAVKDVDSPFFDANDTTPDTFSYLDGSLLWGVWAPKSSSEVRLFVDERFEKTNPPNVKERVYNCREHEEKCYYYNTNNRYAKDCDAERLILKQYVELSKQCPWTVESLSAEISKQLGTPLFTPLSEGFTEDHGRWATLLYSTKRKENMSLFETWKNYMTFEVVKNLVHTYQRSTSIPEDVCISGGKKLDTNFWKAFCRGNFSEAYSFPKVEWQFFRALFGSNKPPNKRPRNLS